MKDKEIEYEGPSFVGRWLGYTFAWGIWGIFMGEVWFLHVGFTAIICLFYTLFTYSSYKEKWIENEIERKEEEKRKIEEEKLRIQKENERKENMYNGKERIFISSSASIQFNKKMLKINKAVYDLDNAEYYLGNQFIRGTISKYYATDHDLLSKDTYYDVDEYKRQVQHLKDHYSYNIHWEAIPVCEYYFCIKNKDGSSYTDYQCSKEKAEKAIEELNSYKEWISKNKK